MTNTQTMKTIATHRKTGITKTFYGIWGHHQAAIEWLREMDRKHGTKKAAVVIH